LKSSLEVSKSLLHKRDLSQHEGISIAVQFTKDLEVRFRDADPAGISYFANVFNFAHDAFEEFIQAAGFAWKEWFQTKDFVVPIRHTECSYNRPFFPGHKYQIQVSVTSIGESSFQMRYIFQQGTNVHAEVRMTHVFLDTKTKTKAPVPEIVRNRLKVYLDATAKK
jgi:YbgC/YbaW family acyl-CoA thioester hydrolase